MTKIKTSELIGTQLDWAVAKCEGLEVYNNGVVRYLDGEHDPDYNPSTDWAYGGPIIERENIIVSGSNAYIYGPDDSCDYASGPTQLIATMRCYVVSKLGDEVEIPDGLM